MSAQKFLTDIENGVVPVNSHDKVLRIAFIYMDEVLWCGTGVFDVIEKLHAHGWSFGVGELRLNRTLDLFYLAQIAAGIYRSSNQIEDIFPSPDEFDTFYTDHHALLHPSAWRAYYSEPFLKQNTTARFYRLPDLQDLPDSGSPLDEPRERSHPHARGNHQPPAHGARTRSRPLSRDVWAENRFGVLAAQGRYDVYEWEGKYSVGGVVEPDVEDGMWKSEVMWCGWPDGGVGGFAWWRGWEGELGGEEEIEFLAAVAVEETIDVELDKLDLAVRSHILLGVMRAAVKTGLETEGLLQELETGMVQSGRIREEMAGLWLREALGVMEPYVRVWEGAWPDADERGKTLRRIFVENGQLFAR
ncbi:hypothetical protein BDV06DRAFT_210536 [Aspergillus oleicola]